MLNILPFSPGFLPILLLAAKSICIVSIAIGSFRSYTTHTFVEAGPTGVCLTWLV